jgi:O-antigen/teichoic acid export membrane protein
VAFPTPDPRSALWAFAVAALVAGTPLVTRAARPAGGVTESERTGATDTLVWSTALWFGGYTTVTLASRYADRFVVGAVLGADSAGVYFALNNSAVAPLLPVVFLARFVHGFVASYRDPSELAPPLKRRLRLLAVITVTAAPLAGMIGGPFVLGIVYPAVDLEPVLVPWLVFAFGRGVFQVRATWESLLSRWGRVGPLLPWESTFLVVEVVGVALASRSFGLAGALYVSGLVYLLSGLTALGLARSLWRGSTEDATEPREAVPGPPG